MAKLLIGTNLESSPLPQKMQGANIPKLLRSDRNQKQITGGGALDETEGANFFSFHSICFSSDQFIEPHIMHNNQ